MFIPPVVTARLLVIQALVSTLVLSVNISAQNRVPGGPNLDETISFMNRMMEPEQRKIEAREGVACSVSIFSKEPLRCSMPVETYEKSTDQNGRVHYGFKYDVFEEDKQVNLNFGDIDPTSVKVEGVASPKFIAENDPDEHRAFLSNPTLRVYFSGPAMLRNQ
jgi:hypothetical protein